VYDVFQYPDFQSILKTAGITVWLLLPAYTPNNFAVVFGGGKPIDLGRNFIDGRRILGNGKTIRGFIAGVFGGILVAHIQLSIENFSGIKVYSALDYSLFLPLITGLACGAMIGDLIGSFIKRRSGFERGQSFPFLDQLGFLAVALFFASFSAGFTELFGMHIIIAAFIITPILHLVTNYIAYRLGLKNAPW